MKFSGHTMGTPDRTPENALGLFAEIGLEGIEFVCDDRSGVNLSLSPQQRRELADRARQLGVEVACLTPYLWEIASAEDALRAEHTAALIAYVRMAAEMDCHRVRAYGGREVPAAHRPDAVNRAADSLRQAAEVAADHAVTLCVENHMGTLTRGGTETRELIRLVDHPSVQVLYDPANALECSGETWEETWWAQRGCLAHVHAKDFRRVGDEREACVIGEGSVPWREIIPTLSDAGYDGFVSLEYEKKWYPEMLPDADVGMRQCRDALASYLSQ